MEHLETHNLLSTYQFGFRKHRSTELEVERFYKNLYTAEPTCPIAQHQMLNNIPRKLTNIQKSFCEGQLSRN